MSPLTGLEVTGVPRNPSRHLGSDSGSLAGPSLLADGDPARSQVTIPQPETPSRGLGRGPAGEAAQAQGS